MIRRIGILTVLGLGIGLVVGVLAVAFVEIVLGLNRFIFVTPESRAGVDRGLLVAVTLGAPTIAGAVLGFLSRYLPEQRFHGVADAVGSAQSLDAKMPVRSGILSTVAALLSLGSGASVGQYGPLAHMGATAGSWLSRTTGDDRSLRTIGIGCGAAAAISAAFHAPIAGVVFAREVVLRHNSVRAFAPIAIAATLGYIVAHKIFDRTPLFHVGEIVVPSPLEYLAFIAIGIAGAFVAVAYMRAVLLAESIAARLRWPAPLKTALAGLALGIVALQVPEVLGIGQEVLRLAMTGETMGAAELSGLLLAKLAMTALCLGFGFAGGVFSPALLIGTLFGALVGSGAEWLVPELHSHIVAYAVCGMVAVTSPVIGAPLTAVLIVFELTQNFDLAAAALVSVACANLVGYRIFGRSFFDKQLEMRGFDLRLGRDKVTAQQHTIRPLISHDYTRCTTDQPLAEIRDALIADKRGTAYIVDATGAFAGTLSLHQLVELVAAGVALEDPAGPHVRTTDAALGPDTSIWTAMAAVEGCHGGSVAVVDDELLVGVLFENEVVSAYLEILDGIRRDEHAVL